MVSSPTAEEDGGEGGPVGPGGPGGVTPPAGAGSAPRTVRVRVYLYVCVSLS